MGPHEPLEVHLTRPLVTVGKKEDLIVKTAKNDYIPRAFEPVRNWTAF